MNTPTPTAAPFPSPPPSQHFCFRHNVAMVLYSSGPVAKPAYRCSACISEKNRAYRQRHAALKR